MRLPDIASYILRDMAKSRVPLAMVAGTLTLALATMISVLGTAFERSGEKLMERATKPVRNVASTLMVKPRAGLFSSSQYEELMRRICDMKGRGEFTEISKVVETIEDDFIHLLNQDGTSSGMYGVHIWSAPHDAAFLRSDRNVQDGLTYLFGGSFTGMKPKSECESYEGQIEPSNKEYAGARKIRWSETFRPRLGVIMNMTYLEKYRAYGKGRHGIDGLAEAIRNRKFPEFIRIEFRHWDDATGTSRVLETELRVTGVINEPVVYPDLIFNEDLAWIYYDHFGSAGKCSEIRRRDGFPARLAARFDQWEITEPLVRIKKDRNPPLLLPVKVLEKDGEEVKVPVNEGQEKITYPQFSGSKCEPYDLLILRLSHWRDEGVRQRLRDKLLGSTALLEFAGEDATDLIELAESSVSREDGSGSVQARALDGLKKILANRIDLRKVDISLPEMVKVRRVGGDATLFQLEDIADRPLLVISRDPTKKTVLVSLLPAWKVTIPRKTLITAILRQQNIMKTYSYVMTAMVVVLAVSASFLLAFGHVLQKTRDIGLLLTNGGSKTAIFAIYIGQIASMVLVGCLCGAALSFAATPLIEEQAADMMQRFLAALPEQGDQAVRDVLDLDGPVFGWALGWVSASALVGALYPVLQATRLDPLSSIGKGG